MNDTKKVRILLVEDHRLVRNGIKMLLETHQEWEVVAEADDGDTALEILSNDSNLDLVITDINIIGIDGITLAQQIHNHHPNVKIIVLSMLSDIEHVARSFESGAQAYLIKTSDYNELMFAIPHVLNGGTYLCENIMLGLIKQVREINGTIHKHVSTIQNLDLPERETEILHLIGDGYTNNEIANKLFLSKRTVEGHRQNLIDKTQVKNSAQLVKYAVKNGLI
jgi:DNA-binding NarL/FixJ family response regulator